MTHRVRPLLALVLVVLVLAAACRGALDQSMLESAGPRARVIERQWWFSFWAATAAYVATIGALCWAVMTARRRERAGTPLRADSDRTMTIAVGAGVGVTLVVLLVFLVHDLSIGRTISGIPGPRPLTITVVGHQWWWEVQYEDSLPQNRLTTANEIHVPVGQPVLFRLQAADVIHSFWVPNLAGKKDLIPGYTQTMWFQADTAGVYRGQCAEFCGLQHAKMAMYIVAEPLARYQAWARRMRDPSAAPATPLAARGGEIFLTGPCAMCHTVTGTSAGSSAGPDLTHLASRRTLAAGSLPNTRGNLAGWILDPQSIKPGASMPATALSPADLDALLAYLEGLR